ncbi:pteridine-dependent deoxygenase [Luteimonas pelagia]
MSRPLPVPGTSPALAIDYIDAATAASALERPGVLAAIGFGDAAAHADPRRLTVPLRPHGPAPVELWRVPNPVVHGRDGELRWSEDGALQFAAIEVDEIAAGGLEAAAEHAYRHLRDCLRRRGYPHPLRIWNYLDAIVSGEGDDERYRRFCVGRARGLGDFDPGTLPAATAIGRRDGVRVLQVYWLAAREPGTPLENPRQVSAYRYPRRYGPQPPSFARAMLPPAGAAMPLLLSGTASVVGHETRHADCVEAQLEETFANFDSLLAATRARAPGLPPAFGRGTRLKAYVRDAHALPRVAAMLADRLGPDIPHVVLHADICRRDLRVEIDGVHG